MCDGTVEFAVGVEVGIHEIELHTAHVHAPYMAVDNTARIRHFHNHGAAVGFHHLLDGELVEVLGLVVGDLLSVDTECLGEVAEAVEETYGGHVHAAVGSFFYVVAGKNAKTAGIYFQTVAQSVFHGEIGYRRNVLAHGLGHIFLEVGIHTVDFSHEIAVGKDFGDSVAGQLLEQHHRIFACGAPQVRVKVAEEGFRFAVPYPPEVLRKLVEGLESGGQFGFHSNVAPYGGISVTNGNFHHM